AVVVEQPAGEGGQGQVGGLAALPAGGGAGVQVAGVGDPGDEGPGLLGVPAPVAAPGVTGPDGARDDRERPQREHGRVDAVGELVQRGGGGQPFHHGGREGARLAAVHQLVLVRVLEQVHDRAHGADVEDRAAQDRRGDVDVQPVRVERRDQLVALGVEDGDGEPEVEQDGGGQEQADPAHVLLQREQREVDADRGGGERDVELVHVAPRRPLHGQRAGDHAAEREEEREHGEGDGDPAVEVALLVTAVGTGPVGHVARPGRGADGDLRPLQDGGAAALPHGDGGAAL